MATDKRIDFSAAFKNVISRYKWTYQELKEKQEAVIKNIVLNERNSIAIFPTGVGKSECYVIPPLVLDDREVGAQLPTSTSYSAT